MNLTVSYLIPSYNHDQYIVAVLDSIKQDIALLSVVAEIIIIDDGSTDNSVALIKSWAQVNKDNVTIKTHFQQNKGIPAVMNALIVQANGTLLRLGSSDDSIIAGSTEKMVKVFVDNPELYAVIGDAIVVDESNQIIYPSSIAFHGGNVKKLTDINTLTQELIKHWCLAGPASLIRRKFYETMSYDESLKIDDFDIYLTLLQQKNRLKFINEKLCWYRIHKNNTSKTRNTNCRIENLKSFLKIIENHLQQPNLAQYLKPLRYKIIAKIYFLQKKWGGCLAYLCLSIMLTLGLRKSRG